MKISILSAMLMQLAVIPMATSFTMTPNSLSIGGAIQNNVWNRDFELMAESSEFLSVVLEKPLGILLEENEENQPKGVKVEDLLDSGSAFSSEYKDQLVGLKLAKVNGEDVSSIGFDDVMDKIIESPSPVAIDFVLEVESDSETLSGPVYEVGQTVTIRVIQEGVETKDIEAKVGNNLRKTLLENNVELYRGLKKKLGNCGGAGSCTFCAVDFVESEGWEKRSDYEEVKTHIKIYSIWHTSQNPLLDA